MKILYIGVPSGTSQQRAQALRNLGHEVVTVNRETPNSGLTAILPRTVRVRLHTRYDLTGVNRSMLEVVRRGGVDVLWADKALMLTPATLREARAFAPNLSRVYYSPDDNLYPSNQTPRFMGAIPHYDLIVTTKSYNVAELKALGAQQVLFIDNAYSAEQHRPLVVAPEERVQLGCAPVGFVGSPERDRIVMMDALARDGVPVVFRNGCRWDRKTPRPRYLQVVEGYIGGDDYARFICGCEINLGFLRKKARDQQTTRTMEIPACGGFMLAERTDEHRRLFREGEEAEFFEGYLELQQKVQYYLAHPEEARRIAENGRRRCLISGYSNESRLSMVLSELGKSNAAGKS